MPDGVYIKRKMRKAIYSGSVPGRSVTQEDSKRGEKLLRNCTGNFLLLYHAVFFTSEKFRFMEEMWFLFRQNFQKDTRNM